MKDQGNAQDAEWGSDAAQYDDGWDQQQWEKWDQLQWDQWQEGWDRGPHGEDEWADHAGSLHACADQEASLLEAGEDYDDDMEDDVEQDIGGEDWPRDEDEGDDENDEDFGGEDW